MTRAGYKQKPPIVDLLRSVLHDGSHATFEFEAAAIRAGYHPSVASRELRCMVGRGELRRVRLGVYERTAPGAHP